MWFRHMGLQAAQGQRRRKCSLLNVAHNNLLCTETEQCVKQNIKSQHVCSAHVNPASPSQEHQEHEQAASDSAG